ncbi:hypothetical protein CHU94_15810 [Rhodoferax sp. TH121]|uniref:hypothetical protein n=1 Tax=Rhodoferax sp. TH121 TaxID=2022803 RepID=UPI000B9791F7|nr:hypothetical protein [Rhodoferax sp. TH121]OYQ38893.1 hypothetical protein CHU94_15810 [Rhodoferax sp. TH121]
MQGIHRSFLVATLGGLCLLGSALAQQNPPPKPPEGQGNGQGGEHRGPPPDALAACTSLASGAACTMTTPQGSMSGTCGAPEGKPLACRPARPPQGHGQGDSGNKSPPPPKPAN